MREPPQRGTVGRPRAARIRFVNYPDENLRVAALEAGDIDITETLPWQAFDGVERHLQEVVALARKRGVTRIIAGAARGRRLAVPPKGTRPTSDRVRESLFSVLDSALLAGDRGWQDISVLDLYAGSGALGLEALSRGAAFVTFVEKNGEIIKVLEKNIAKAGFDVAPLLLAYVLGAMFEQSLRQGLIIGYGSPMVFLQSPISATFLALAALVIAVPQVLRLAARFRKI